MRLASGRWLIGALSVVGCSLFSDTDELGSRAPGKDAGTKESGSGSGGGGIAGAGAWASGGADSGVGAAPTGGVSGAGNSGGTSAGAGGGLGATGGVMGGGGTAGCGSCPTGTTCDSLTQTCVACGSHGGVCCDPPAQCAGDATCCSSTGIADHKCYDCMLEPAACSCLVCCAVCQGGTPKSTPLPVDASETCDQVANQWCIGKGIPNGANISNSGWKKSCS